MTLFLRNDKNQTLVDIEINFGDTNYDLHSSVIIEPYSELLLENLNRSEEVIRDFSEMDELRGWFWEVYMEDSNPSEQGCIEKVKGFMMVLADKYNLHYIVD